MIHAGTCYTNLGVFISGDSLYLIFYIKTNVFRPHMINRIGLPIGCLHPKSQGSDAYDLLPRDILLVHQFLFTKLSAFFSSHL